MRRVPRSRSLAFSPTAANGWRASGFLQFLLGLRIFFVVCSHANVVGIAHSRDPFAFQNQTGQRRRFRLNPLEANAVAFHVLVAEFAWHFPPASDLFVAIATFSVAVLLSMDRASKRLVIERGRFRRHQLRVALLSF